MNKNKTILIIITLVFGLFISGCLNPDELKVGDTVYVHPYFYAGNVYGGNSISTVEDGYYYCQKDETLISGNGCIKTSGLTKFESSISINQTTFPIIPQPYYNPSDIAVYAFGWRYDSTYFSSYCKDKYTDLVSGEPFPTCYELKNDIKIIHNANILNVTIWEVQNSLNKKAVYENSVKTITETQSIVYEEVNFNILKKWMDNYGLKYNNRSITINDFSEVKKNVPFMDNYCKSYVYSGYDLNKGCYRIV